MDFGVLIMVIIELNPENRKKAIKTLQSYGKTNIDILYVKAFLKRWDLFFSTENNAQVSDYFWDLSGLKRHIKKMRPV